MNLAGSILLAAAEGGRWRPGIGDPTVLGWVTVAAYLGAAIVCGLASLREPMPDGTRRPRGRPSRFWLILAGLMLALGVNKQLDLQSLVTQIGRDVVRALDLYSGRRELQIGFIAVVILSCLATVAGLLWASWRTLKRVSAACASTSSRPLSMTARPKPPPASCTPASRCRASMPSSPIPTGAPG